MIVTLPGAFLWLWHSMCPLYDCEISWGLSVIVKLPSATFLGLSMIAATPGVSLWLWHFLGPLMIVTLPVTSYWLWHFLGPLNDCDTSQGLSMVVTLPVGSVWLWHILWLLYNCGWKSAFGLSQWNLIYLMFKMLIIIDKWLYNWYDIMQGNLILLIRNFDIYCRFYSL